MPPGCKWVSSEHKITPIQNANVGYPLARDAKLDGIRYPFLTVISRVVLYAQQGGVMTRADKRLWKMRENPRDWCIEELQSVADSVQEMNNERA